MKVMNYVLKLVVYGFGLSFLFGNHVFSQSQIQFNKGVNLTNWFQASNARQIQFTKFTKKDFENIKSLGADVIRLPINLHAMTNGQPDYVLDPLFLEFLDQAVNWAEELQLSILLDNHTFDPAVSTDVEVGPVLIKVWQQMANHFKDRSEYVYYEILNEPHGISDAAWGQIQQTVIDAIRLFDVKHYIIVGGSGYNGYSNLANLPIYTDSKLVYTFHFYEPFIFTHQGASWVEPSLVPLANVPFPYSAARMPSVPASLKGTWIESALSNYATDGTVTHVKQLLDITSTFKLTRNVPVFCGEFGVYIPNSDNSQRVTWYMEVRKYLEQLGIPWTIWDYTGGFGLFEKNSNDLFDSDLSIPLIEALGFQVPPQQEYLQPVVNKPFYFYDDYIEQGIEHASYFGKGIIDYYNQINPSKGKYAIRWTGVEQYSTIVFDFKPDINFLQALQNNFALEFWVRGTTPGSKFNVRFVDTKRSVATDHPWRMDKVIDESEAVWDNQWHKVSVPLSDFKDGGSYDDGAYINPPGKFDWSQMDRFELVAEYSNLDNIEFWFDEIRINGEEFVVTRVENTIVEETVKISPNPINEKSRLEYDVFWDGVVQIEMLSANGVKIKELISEQQMAGHYVLNLNEAGDLVNNLPNGLYFVKVRLPQGISMQKVVLIK